MVAERDGFVSCSHVQHSRATPALKDGRLATGARPWRLGDRNEDPLTAQGEFAALVAAVALLLVFHGYPWVMQTFFPTPDPVIE